MSREENSAIEQRSDRGGSSLPGEFLRKGYVVALHPISADDIALLVDALEMAAGTVQKERVGGTN